MHKNITLMINREAQLASLENLIKWKESKAFYAKKLGLSLEELDSLMRDLKEKKTTTNAASPESKLAQHEVNTDQFQVNSGWVKDKDMSIQFSKKKLDATQAREEFKKFLKEYTPSARQISNKHHGKAGNSCLVVNKQDAHLNKLDVSGDNNIGDRFMTFYKNLIKILEKSTATSNLQKVVYVLGSDEFNSEHTGRTVHDTPQQNIGDYFRTFEAICAHEVTIINLLQEYADTVNIIYIPGNHDEHVGWHMVHWLKTYYRNCTNVQVEDSPSYTKYIKFSNTGMCFNHGYIVKPEMLAQNFPIEFKQYWSSCDNFYIFTGDKHTELSRQIGGIKFYRLAQISKAKSKWDHERGYAISKGELTAFLIEEGEGLTDIYHQAL